MENTWVELVEESGDPAPSWLVLGNVSPVPGPPNPGAGLIGALAVGETRDLTIAAAPGVDVPVSGSDPYRFNLRVFYANAEPVDVPVYVFVGTSGRGSVLFFVSDIYTGLPIDPDNPDGPINMGVPYAQVELEKIDGIPIQPIETATDDSGELFLTDLPTGKYRYRISAGRHDSKSGDFEIRPGVTARVEEFLMNTLITIEWEVTPTVIEDRYEIVMTAEYETDVPAPVLKVEPLLTMLPEMQTGDVYTGELMVTNLGLKCADDLEHHPPDMGPEYALEFLADVPERLEAGHFFRLPFKVTKVGNKLSKSGGGLVGFGGSFLSPDPCAPSVGPYYIGSSTGCQSSEPGIIINGEHIPYFSPVWFGAGGLDFLLGPSGKDECKRDNGGSGAGGDDDDDDDDECKIVIVGLRERFVLLEEGEEEKKILFYVSTSGRTGMVSWTVSDSNQTGHGNTFEATLGAGTYEVTATLNQINTSCSDSVTVTVVQVDLDGVHVATSQEVKDDEEEAIGTFIQKFGDEPEAKLIVRKIESELLEWMLEFSDYSKIKVDGKKITEPIIVPGDEEKVFNITALNGFAHEDSIIATLKVSYMIDSSGSIILGEDKVKLIHGPDIDGIDAYNGLEYSEPHEVEEYKEENPGVLVRYFSDDFDDSKDAKLIVRPIILDGFQRKISFSHYDRIKLDDGIVSEPIILTDNDEKIYKITRDEEYFPNTDDYVDITMELIDAQGELCGKDKVRFVFAKVEITDIFPDHKKIVPVTIPDTDKKLRVNFTISPSYLDISNSEVFFQVFDKKIDPDDADSEDYVYSEQLVDVAEAGEHDAEWDGVCNNTYDMGEDSYNRKDLCADPRMNPYAVRILLKSDSINLLDKEEDIGIVPKIVKVIPTYEIKNGLFDVDAVPGAEVIVKTVLRVEIDRDDLLQAKYGTFTQYSNRTYNMYPDRYLYYTEDGLEVKIWNGINYKFDNVGPPNSSNDVYYWVEDFESVTLKSHDSGCDIKVQKWNKDYLGELDYVWTNMRPSSILPSLPIFGWKSAIAISSPGTYVYQVEVENHAVNDAGVKDLLSKKKSPEANQQSGWLYPISRPSAILIDQNNGNFPGDEVEDVNDIFMIHINGIKFLLPYVPPIIDSVSRVESFIGTVYSDSLPNNDPRATDHRDYHCIDCSGLVHASCWMSTKKFNNAQADYYLNSKYTCYSQVRQNQHEVYRNDWIGVDELVNGQFDNTWNHIGIVIRYEYDPQTQAEEFRFIHSRKWQGVVYGNHTTYPRSGYHIQFNEPN